jgi:hypothetical protein
MKLKCKRQQCGKEFKQFREGHVYCSGLCRKRDYREGSGMVHPRKIYRGASSELQVAAWLLDWELPTFRSVSPHSPCDLVFAYGGKLFGVECRTGWINNATGVLGHPTGVQGLADFLVVYVPEVGAFVKACSDNAARAFDSVFPASTHLDACGSFTRIARTPSRGIVEHEEEAAC